MLLRRRLVDFSSERSMSATVDALREHYGVELSASVVNKVTRQTGSEAKKFNADAPVSKTGAELLVVELDGSMVPIVEYGEPSGEQKASGTKRSRSCFWKEFRLCTASRPEGCRTRYAVTDGSPLEAGWMMYHNCRLEGMDEATHIHGVAGGAPWIVDQYEQQFGANHDFLIDFYHVSEYLATASDELDEDPAGKRDWHERQRQHLKDGKADMVIDELTDLSLEYPNKQAVETCLRYLDNRNRHLDYATALQQGLPIGSGEVESAHRSVLQKRLKKPGAWRLRENAETMAQLKTLQANGHWEELWDRIAA